MHAQIESLCNFSGNYTHPRIINRYICSSLWCRIQWLNVEEAGRMRSGCGHRSRNSSPFIPVWFKLPLLHLFFCSHWWFTSLSFRNCSVHMRVHVRGGGHFSCLPLSIVAILRAREAWHWIHFILSPNCFLHERYCKAICVQHEAKTQWPRERHLVSFVSLDLLVASVIDFWLCRGGTNEQRVEFFFLIPSSLKRRLSVDPV